MPNIIHVKNTEGILQAIIIKADYTDNGVHFFTDDSYSQQLAYMHHPAGKLICPHIHNEVYRSVYLTQEVLVIKRGRLRVDFFTNQKEYFASCLLSAGDVIILVSGGHGFFVIEELEMYEIKQGPYLGDQDKIRFESIVTDPIWYECT